VASVSFDSGRLGSAEEADEQLSVIDDMLRHRDEPPMSEAWLLEELDHTTGYAAWSNTYDEPGNLLIDAEESVLKPILAGLPVGDAADVACGTGRLVAMLCELGHSVIGIDPSPEMLEIAEAKDLPATFLRGSFEALPLPDDSVDLVTCALALTHVTDLSGPVAEIARILRPRGRAILTDVHPMAVATGGQAFFHRADGSRAVTINLQHWVSDYIRAFDAAGLAIKGCHEPLVDDGFTAGFEADDLRAAADLGLSGLPLLLVWVLTKG
jgi:SAM-dependent methyltransferase